MTIIRSLSEGISHIEDLPIDVFIDVLRKMPEMVGFEKLDGAQLWLGIDENNRFYTSREGKRTNSERKYHPEDWPQISAFNQFRAAHAALMTREIDIKRVMRSGDTIEAEVLFGKQPNSVTYGAQGKSYIAFLRGVNNTPDTIADHLGQVLKNQQAEAKVDLVQTTDGETLSVVNQTFTFEFTVPQAINPAKLDASAEVEKHLKALESFLSKQSSVKELTNKQLMLAQLNQVPKELRAVVKQARADMIAHVQTEFKLPIKQALLNKVVRQLKTSLAEPGDANDIGIEGVVLRNPKTGEQFKIVDKDVFTTVNKFNQSVRGEIQSALNTVDPDSPIEARGGLVGALRIEIADMLGNRDLAKASNVRKILEPIRGNSPEEAIKNMAKSMPAIDDYEAIKKKALALTSAAASELKAKLDDFKENQGNYQLKLKNGKEISLSADTIDKTLLSFAEARRNLSTLFDKIKSSKSLAQFLAIMYGAQAKAVHAQELQEMLTENFNGDIDHAEYENKSLYQLVNSYLSTMFMAMLIIYERDTIGLRRLRDKRNYMMKSWKRDMSPVNFWGYVIWRSSRADVKKAIGGKSQAELERATKRIPNAQWKRMHQEFGNDQELRFDWDRTHKVLQHLIDFTGLRSDRLNKLLENMIDWPELTYDEQVKTLSKLYMHAQQFVPRSSLFTRLRVIQNNKLLSAAGTNDQMIAESLLKGISALSEDDAADAAPSEITGTPVSTGVATTSNAVAARPERLGQGHIIRRKRNLTVKKLTMKFPDPRRKHD